jgi:hypothetical protein
MFSTKMSLAIGLAVSVVGGAFLVPAPAQAGSSTGTWRNGMVAGPRGVGLYGGGYGYRGGGFGYRPGGFGYRPAAYGYSPAAYGYRSGGYGYRPVGYGYRPAAYGYRPYYGYPRYRSNYGGAVAAGLIGGLALGALASAPAYSYPAYSYPAYPAGYAGDSGYYGASAYGAPVCYVVRRRVVDAWGRVFVRRTQVCE